MNRRIISVFQKNIMSLVLMLLIFLPFIILLVQGKVIYWGTASLQFVPWNQFLYDSLLDGTFPLWNPYNGLGSPFVANHQSAVFYPLNWLLFPFYLIGRIKGLSIGITLLIPIHLSVAALGMMKVLQHLGKSKFSQILGAMVFVFSGYILTRLSFISMVWAFAWIPWVFFTTLRIKEVSVAGTFRAILSLAIVLTMQILAGHAQTTFYTLLVAIFVVIFHDFKKISTQILKVASLFISLLISMLLSAIQILPTFEFLQNSQRSAEVGYDLAMSSSLWPGRLLTSFFANFWGNPNTHRFLSGGSFWEENLYVGVLPILFTSILFWVLFRKNRAKYFPSTQKSFVYALIGLGLFAIFFSLGRFFVLFPFLYKYIPTFDLFQAPSRFLVVYVLLMSILAAYSYDLWSKSKFNYRKTIIYFVIFGSLVIFTILIKIFYKELPTITLNSLMTGSVLGLSFGLLTILKDRTKFNMVWIQIIVFLLFGVDSIFHNFSWNNFQPIEVYENINTSQNFVDRERILLQPKAEEFLKFSLFFRPDRLQAITDLRDITPDFLPNTNLVNNRFQLINNFDPLKINDFADFWQFLSQQDPQELEEFLPLLGVTRIIDLEPSRVNYFAQTDLNSKGIVQWYGCAIEEKRNLNFDHLFQIEIKNPQNRCLIVKESLVTNDPETVLSKEDVQIRITKFSPNKISISFSSDQPGWIAIRQNWYPGWKAILDGKEIIEIQKVDYLFQGIKVPAGMHSLELVYFPNSFLVGVVITSLSFIALIIYFLILCYSKNRKNDKI